MVPGRGGGGEMAGHLQAAGSVLLQEPPRHHGLRRHLGVRSGRCPPPTVGLEQVSVTQKASITTARTLNITMSNMTMTNFNHYYKYNQLSLPASFSMRPFTLRKK